MGDRSSICFFILNILGILLLFSISLHTYYLNLNSFFCTPFILNFPEEISRISQFDLNSTVIKATAELGFRKLLRKRNDDIKEHQT